MKVTIKRQFAVWLEDAIQVDVPEGIEDLREWAVENYDELYSRAKSSPQMPGVPTLLWEDEHKADLDFPEVEYVVEADPIDNKE